MNRILQLLLIVAIITLSRMMIMNNKICSEYFENDRFDIFNKSSNETLDGKSSLTSIINNAILDTADTADTADTNDSNKDNSLKDNVQKVSVSAPSSAHLTINDVKIKNTQLKQPKKSKRKVSYHPTVMDNIRKTIGTDKLVVEYPKVYPISVDHTFDNLDNLTDNNTINKINELTNLAVNKANNKSHMIIYNAALRQSKSIKMNDEETRDYGNFLVETINAVSVYKRFKFSKVINISKDQMENQMRMNFHLELAYKNPDANEPILLRFNVIFLFERLYDDDDQFFDHQANNKEIFVYLDTFRLIGLPNNGFLPGYDKN